MIKERLIAELCDFGVVYSLYVKIEKSHVHETRRRALLKISWEEELAADKEPKTRSAVFELNLEAQEMKALGRKGNQLPAAAFSAQKLCQWAARELAESAL
ncbi:MAG TPA: hypothetical protein VKX17_09055 [Planctomycetota bacterium]|nr:hypothetical protein [Planctomycetota bacterium]